MEYKKVLYLWVCSPNAHLATLSEYTHDIVTDSYNMHLSIRRMLHASKDMYLNVTKGISKYL